MHSISRKTNGYKIYAVSGINSISFAIDFEDADTKGLLGFAVERHDKTDNERYFMRGFKVFQNMIPNPDENTAVSTFEHPVQSFVWDDFTGKPDHDYEYFFHPLKGAPRNIDRSAPPIAITVKTEPLYDATDEHDVFFNRGVASSQAYFRKFHNAIPGDITDPTKAKEVFDWLARDLQNAMMTFIDQAKKGDSLRACFYEFRHRPIVQKLKDAIDRGVDVRIIIDAKANKESFPKSDNLQMIKAVGIPAKYIVLRQANPNDIQHNKFMVFLNGKDPAAVWTGSTNVSEGGIFGQTNVGHWVRNKKTAIQFLQYWDILAQDPGGQATDTRSEKIAKNQAFKQKVVALQGDIETGAVQQVRIGITPIFSPRTSLTMLKTYAALLDDAESCAAITLAFGIADVFKEILADNTNKDQITFMLLEKRDQPALGQTKKFTSLTATNNVYEAWGSYIKDPLYQWTKEINNQIIKLNQHVLYIHSKFMLVDPLGDVPIIVTGSANFSGASTTSNDENMIVIKGNRRAADIYFTEFNRLFNHYYFRSVYESRQKQTDSTENSLFLVPNDSWLSKYEKGKLRYKRVMMFRKLAT